MRFGNPGCCLPESSDATTGAARSAGRRTLRHPRAFRRQLLYEWKYQHQSAAGVARKYGLPHSLLYKWLAQYENENLGPIDLHLGPPKPGQEHEEEHRSLMEQHRLEIQNRQVVPIRKTGISFFQFAREVCGYDKITELEHRDVCDWIDSATKDWAAKRKSGIRLQARRKMEMPRGSLKTTLARAWVLWVWAEIDANLRINLDSAIRSLSKVSLAAIKWHLSANPIFIQRYGEWKPPSKSDTHAWTKTEIDHLLRSDWRRVGPSLSTSGTDQIQTGHHYDAIILDDIHDKKNVRTMESLEKCWEHYRALLSLLEPDGLLWLLGTPWADGDVLERVDKIYTAQRQEQIKGVTVDVTWGTYRKPAIDENGKLGFPGLLPASFLADVKRDQGPRFYNLQYMLRRIASGDKPFDTSKIVRYDHADLPKPGSLNVYITIDPASSEQKGADWTAVIGTGWASDGAAWWLDGWIDRCPLAIGVTRALDMADQLHAEWGLREVAVETVGFQSSWKYELERQMKERRSYYVLRELKPDNERKGDRILRIQPIVSNKLLHVPKICPHYSHYFKNTINMADKFVEHLGRYPEPMVPVDFPDCFAYQWRVKKDADKNPSIAALLRRSMSPHDKETLRLLKTPKAQKKNAWMYV